MIEIIEPENIIIPIVIGFGLVVFYGFASWLVSLVVRFFIGIIKGI